jgi:hypothetical protein
MLAPRGREGLGFVLGILFGPIGVLIATQLKELPQETSPVASQAVHATEEETGQPGIASPRSQPQPPKKPLAAPRTPWG